jgi:hypothetical protein
MEIELNQGEDIIKKLKTQAEKIKDATSQYFKTRQSNIDDISDIIKDYVKEFENINNYQKNANLIISQFIKIQQNYNDEFHKIKECMKNIYCIQTKMEELEKTAANFKQYESSTVNLKMQNLVKCINQAQEMKNALNENLSNNINITELQQFFEEFYKIITHQANAIKNLFSFNINLNNSSIEGFCKESLPNSLNDSNKKLENVESIFKNPENKIRKVSKENYNNIISNKNNLESSITFDSKKFKTYYEKTVELIVLNTLCDKYTGVNSIKKIINEGELNKEYTSKIIEKIKTDQRFDSQDLRVIKYVDDINIKRKKMINNIKPEIEELISFISKVSSTSLSVNKKFGSELIKKISVLIPNLLIKKSKHNFLNNDYEKIKEQAFSD